MKTPNKRWVLMLWIAVLGLATFLRFDQLSDRPFHFDEATGARITSLRLDNSSAGYSFNPKHHHGPLLSAVAAPICALAGESSWKSMTKLSLRLGPALAGTLLVLMPLLWRKRFGDLPMLAAAALLATSPILVYYSRMFIHEMLLAFCGLAALLLLCWKPKSNPTINPKPILLGLFIGLMFATKESFIISLIAWSAAGLLIAISHRNELAQIGWKKLTRDNWRLHRYAIAISLMTAAITAILFYTNGLRNPEGAWDAARTFFIYKTGAGHDASFFYYFNMMAVPSKGAIWWFETPVLILAVIAFLRTYWPKQQNDNRANKQTDHQIDTIRFLAYVIVIHILIYSLFSYKTPWLMCLPWCYTCLLAGLSFRGAEQWRMPMKIAVLLLFSAVLFQQTRLTRFAAGRFASDARNPYAYAPTSRNVELLEQWMPKLCKELPPQALEPVAVVGTEFWPLPWYLRNFDTIGYWPEPNPAITDCPLVLAMPKATEEMNAQLEKTHIARTYTLRANVAVMLYLRKDYWDQWIGTESPEEIERSDSPDQSDPPTPPESPQSQ